MGLRDKYDFETLVNEAERLVIDEMERLLSTEKYKDTCRCEDCILDMAALALNGTRPLYRVSLLGSLYTSSSSLEKGEYLEEIKASVQKAVDKVRANPSH